MKNITYSENITDTFVPSPTEPPDPVNSSKYFFGFSKQAFRNDPHVIVSEYLMIFILLITLSLIAQFFVGKVFKLKYFPEIGATILIGMTVSGLIRLSGESSSSSYNGVGILGFSSPVFFIGLLPPIIFNSGYQIKRRLFFAHIVPILALAVIGTTISAFVIGGGLYYLGKLELLKKLSIMESVSFGALISSTDPVSTLAVFSDLRVDPTLFYLVFGESVLNDAISIVLFKTTSKYVGLDIRPEDTIIAILDFCICFIGSCVIGYSLGLISAWLFKMVDFQGNRLVIVSVFVSTVYVPFLLSEMLQLSGVVTILFSAIASRRYISKNIPSDSKLFASFVFELMAYLSETTVFLSLGMAVIDKEIASSFEPGFICWTLMLCLIGRAVHIYPLLGLVNVWRYSYAKYHKTEPDLIPMNTQHMIFFSGLRGAVAYACANIFSDVNNNRGLIQTTTMVIILFTIFVKGGGTFIVLTYLEIPMDVDVRASLSHLRNSKFPLLRYEKKYILPLVTKDGCVSSDSEIALSCIRDSSNNHTPSPMAMVKSIETSSDTTSNPDSKSRHKVLEYEFSSSDESDDGEDFEPQEIQDLHSAFTDNHDSEDQNDIIDHSLGAGSTSSFLQRGHKYPYDYHGDGGGSRVKRRLVEAETVLHETDDERRGQSHPDNLRIRAAISKRDPITRRINSGLYAKHKDSYSSLYNFGRAGHK